MPAEIEFLKQSTGSTEEASSENEVVLHEKLPVASVLDPLRAIRFLVGRAVFQAVSTVHGFQQDAFHTSFQEGGTAIVRHLVSAAQINKLIQATNARIDDLRNLPQDWHAHGATQISINAVQQAKGLLVSLSEWYQGILGERIAPEGVIPLADGGVELAWRGSQGVLEVLISPSNEMDYVIEIGEGLEARYEDGDVSIDRLPVLLNRIS